MKAKAYIILYIYLLLRFLGGSLLAAKRNIPCKLPSGSSAAGAFGAYYTRLYYTPEWEKPWRVGDYADVVVRFDTSPVKFVFWRGASYVPCWVTENDIWYTNEWWETSDRRDKQAPLPECEPIMDKQCRYSHVRIIENNPARVVIHWRYALSNVDYRLPYVDPATGWGDWADEYYTIYPDATCIRNLTGWSTYPHQGWFGDPNQGIAHRECHESIIINQPGSKPDDNIEQSAVTLANLKGQEKTYLWKNGAPEFAGQPEDACIQMINLKAKYKPFVVVEPENVWFRPFREFAGKSHAPGSNFFCWDHWPVSQEENVYRFITSYDRPSHTSLCHIIWSPYEKTDNSITYLLLNGLTEKSAAEMVPLAKSWIYPPELKLTSGNFSSKGYDKAQKAYILTCNKAGKPSKLKFELAASEEKPVVNPAFVIDAWGENQPELKINGKLIEQNNDSRIAHRRRLEATDLIIWLKTESNKPLKLELMPLHN